MAPRTRSPLNAWLVMIREHLLLRAVGGFIKAIQLQSLGGAATALVEGCDESAPRTHLLELVLIHALHASRLKLCTTVSLRTPSFQEGVPRVPPAVGSCLSAVRAGGSTPMIVDSPRHAARGCRCTAEPWEPQPSPGPHAGRSRPTWSSCRPCRMPVGTWGLLHSGWEVVINIPPWVYHR